MYTEEAKLLGAKLFWWNRWQQQLPPCVSDRADARLASGMIDIWAITVGSHQDTASLAAASRHVALTTQAISCYAGEWKMATEIKARCCEDLGDLAATHKPFGLRIVEEGVNGVRIAKGMGGDGGVIWEGKGRPKRWLPVWTPLWFIPWHKGIHFPITPTDQSQAPFKKSGSLNGHHWKED